MPFTVNVGPYVGGQLMAQGIGNLGQGIGEGLAAIGKTISENQKAHDEQGADQIILNYGKQIGLVSPEEEGIYIKGNDKAKTAMIGGLLRKFTMQQQVQQQQSLEADRQTRRDQGQQDIDLRRAEATWTPPPEAVAAAKETDTPYLPIGPGKYALRSPKSADQMDTVDWTDPTTGEVHKISTRSSLGMKILEKKNPEQALEWNYGIDKSELFNSDLHKAGTVDPNTQAFKPSDPKVATHIQIGGGTVMPIQAFRFYQNRLNKAGQNPNAQPDTSKAAPANDPKVGDTRTINGTLAVWDGKGWKAKQ